MVPTGITLVVPTGITFVVLHRFHQIFITVFINYSRFTVAFPIQISSPKSKFRFCFKLATEEATSIVAGQQVQKLHHHLLNSKRAKIICDSGRKLAHAQHKNKTILGETIFRICQPGERRVSFDR